MKGDIKMLQQQMNEGLDWIQASTKMKVYPESHRSRASDKNSVNYSLMNVEDSKELLEFISCELELCHLNKSGTLKQMWHRLKAAMFHETRMQALLDEVKHNAGVGAALFLVMRALPCILNFKNQVSLNFFNHVTY